jgi:putative cell wall-binding protein
LAVVLVVPVAAQGTYIIVSDSDCDVAMAELLASVMEAKIVKVEWGSYDEEALEELVEKDPETVIIIGGSMAVVDQIQDFLESMGFPIFRIAGEDRKETSLEVYRSFKDYFNDDFAVIVVDTNRSSIWRGKRLAIRNSVPLFFCDVSELDDLIKEVDNLGIEEVKIISGNRQDDLRTTCEKRLKEAQERFEKIVETIEASEEPESEEEIESEEASEEPESEEEIESEEESEESVNEELLEAVEECRKLLEKAIDAFEDGNYLKCLEYLVDVEKLLNELEETL